MVYIRQLKHAIRVRSKLQNSSIQSTDLISLWTCLDLAEISELTRDHQSHKGSCYLKTVELHLSNGVLKLY